MNNVELGTLYGAGSIPLIVAVVQVFKGLIPDTRWYAMLALIFGIAINMGIGSYLNTPVIVATIQGLVAGLSASGLYSFGSTLKEGAAAHKNDPNHKV